MTLFMLKAVENNFKELLDTVFVLFLCCGWNHLVSFQENHSHCDVPALKKQ